MSETIANELASDHGKTHFQFKMTKKTAERTETREVIETDVGSISRLISINGNALPPERQKQEAMRLQRLLDRPEDWRAQQLRQRSEDDDTNKILKAIPNAFLFEAVGVRHGATGEVALISFRPNPDFRPASREAQVLEGMAGTMEIDLSAHRIVRFRASLIRGVKFGWGVLGRLNPGGRLIIEQSQIGSGRWDTTHTLVDLTGTILLVKKFTVHEEDINQNYRPVPDLGLAAAVQFLQKQAYR